MSPYSRTQLYTYRAVSEKNNELIQGQPGAYLLNNKNNELIIKYPHGRPIVLVGVDNIAQTSRMSEL